MLRSTAVMAADLFAQLMQFLQHPPELVFQFREPSGNRIPHTRPTVARTAITTRTTTARLRAVVMLTVVMLTVVMLTVVMLTGVMLTVLSTVTRSWATLRPARTSTFCLRAAWSATAGAWSTWRRAIEARASRSPVGPLRERVEIGETVVRVIVAELNLDRALRFVFVRGAQFGDCDRRDKQRGTGQ